VVSWGGFPFSDAGGFCFEDFQPDRSEPLPETEDQKTTHSSQNHVNYFRKLHTETSTGKAKVSAILDYELN